MDPSDGVFGRFDLAALGGCHTLNVCYVMLYRVLGLIGLLSRLGLGSLGSLDVRFFRESYGWFVEQRGVGHLGNLDVKFFTGSWG